MTLYRSIQERKDRGKAARDRTPRSIHSGWGPAATRPDPVALLEAQNVAREPDLVPVRHGRMMISPLMFYRGAAVIMAADLKATPVAGLHVQLCGDAHLCNFGVFASPERTLVFDVNDFDETLPGPFEYDVKRLAASFAVAARGNGFSAAEVRESARACVASYRGSMASFARMRTMDVWYAHLEEEQAIGAVRGALAKVEKETKAAKKGSKKARQKAEERQKRARRGAKEAEKSGEKARTRDSLQALSKLGELAGGQYRIIGKPPIVIPARDLAVTYGMSTELVDNLVREQFQAYRATLRDDRRRLLERFEIVDMARKVVGVGSVGSQAFIVLLQGRDVHDPLFLQIKEAMASVLEGYLPRSRYRQHGKRVVQGQRMMQAASDIYLGWTTAPDTSRHFYWRQLRDMKGSADVESMTPPALTFYARTCGWTLARAHARSGDPVAIAEYLGDGDTFDKSITDFSERYAGQNELDYQEFLNAIRSGRLDVVEGV
jgi:uncharacterized protein (DUF2252 family)